MHMAPAVCAMFLAFGLSGCIAARAVGAAVEVAGAVVGTTAEITGEMVGSVVGGGEESED